VFETLFPIRELEDWQRQEQEQAERAIQLADCWVQTNPADTIPTLVECENEARLVGQSWPRWSPFVCQRIAERVDNHELWAEGLLDGSASVDLVQPFVRKLLPPNTAAAVRVIKRCLDDEKYQLATAITILACEGVPAPLVEASLAGIKGGGEWIRTLCSCSELAESIVRLLLVHPDDAIASAAAVGEWAAAPEGIVRESLQREWEQAILRCSGDEYSLPTILRADPALCTRWISRVLRASSNVWRYDDTITALVRELKTADRRALMSGFRADRHSPEIMQALVGPDLGLYSELLQDRQLARVHLAPLIGHPDMSDWVCKAQIALDSGYSVDDVVRAALSGVHSWVGHESDMWKEWAHRFDELKSHADDRIRRIGTVGRSAAAERCERALAGERAEAVRGF
jgi:hypothetical protein